MPIVTGATVVDLRNGLTLVMFLVLVLWFGDRINPNQCRHYGILFYDYPKDKYLDLVLLNDDNFFILMGMEGTTCGFDSRYPTLE